MAGGAIAFPVAVFVHELGHFGVFAAFGFPDPVLRYASTSWSGSGEFARLMRAGDMEAAAALVQPWQVAIGVAAGVIISYLTVIACVLAVRRFGPGPAFPGSRSRAGDPAALAGGDSDLRLKAPRSAAIHIEHGRGLAGGAHGDPRGR